MWLPLLLTLHSWIRWAVVLLTIVVGARCAAGWARRRSWSSEDGRWGRAWVGTVDLQVTLGLWLYFVASPTAAAARQDFQRAWRDGTLRFFGIVHPSAMLLAAIVVHVAWAWTRRADERARERFLRLGSGAVCAATLVLMAIPWPFLPYGRALARM